MRGKGRCSPKAGQSKHDSTHVSSEAANRNEVTVWQFFFSAVCSTGKGSNCDTHPEGEVFIPRKKSYEGPHRTQGEKMQAFF